MPRPTLRQRSLRTALNTLSALPRLCHVALFGMLGAACGGGTAVHSGLETDGSGAREQAEIDASTYVSNGANGLSSVFRLEPLATGSAECSDGGTRLETGLDVDRDGELSALEVLATRAVCHGAAGARGLRHLVLAGDEQPGGECPAGGKKLETGRDDDGDGTLESSEVEQVSFVCHGSAGDDGADGRSALVAVSAERAGLQCAAGGKKLENGLDLDASGVLEPSEVTATAYVCNGADGSDSTDGTNGTNGLTAMIALTPEDSGPNCAEGGKKLETGLDVDASGELDPFEVTSTGYVCNGATGTTGSNGTNRSNGLNSLVRVNPQAPGSECSFGGQKIEVGLDLDADQELSVAEVQQIRYVCDGAGWVLRANEEPGATCELGGIRLETGVDLNDNDVLDDAEVRATDYVCNQQRSSMFAADAP